MIEPRNKPHIYEDFIYNIGHCFSTGERRIEQCSDSGCTCEQNKQVSLPCTRHKDIFQMNWNHRNNNINIYKNV